MKLLEGKTALITGGARGIGKAISLKYAQHGANIAFTDLVEDDNFKSTENELRALGVKAKGFISDASKFEDSQVLVDNVIKEFGTLEILVNNAGITRDTRIVNQNF